MVPVRVWIVLACASLLVLAAPFAVAAPKEKIDKRVYDEHGRLTWEIGHHADGTELGFARHYARPPGGGGGGGGLTDCKSTAYRLGGWHWDRPYSATASSHAALFETAASTWDAATSRAIHGSIVAGSAGVAGVQDFKNQIDFVDLGASTTIAVTTTWYYISNNTAVESDGQYNLYYAWATDGSGGAMDVQNIATHEIGHTFGLDHPKGQPGKIGCLTMYAYGSLGETAKRSLGDGDILGLRALYGT